MMVAVVVRVAVREVVEQRWSQREGKGSGMDITCNMCSVGGGGGGGGRFFFVVVSIPFVRVFFMTFLMWWSPSNAASVSR